MTLHGGKRVVSWSDDGTLKLWDWSMEAHAGTRQGHTKKVRGALTLPDRRHVVSWSVDGTLKLWDSFAGECERTHELDL